MDRAGQPSAGADRCGAGDGNRTHVCSLEGCRSTIELRPPEGIEPRPPEGRPARTIRRARRSREIGPTEVEASLRVLVSARADRASPFGDDAPPSDDAELAPNHDRVLRGPRARGSGWNRIAMRNRRLRDDSRAGRAGDVTTGREHAKWKWWGEADSNRRRLSHQIYSLARLAAPESPLRRAPRPATRARQVSVLVLGSKRQATPEDAGSVR